MKDTAIRIRNITEPRGLSRERQFTAKNPCDFDLPRNSLNKCPSYQWPVEFDAVIFDEKHFAVVRQEVNSPHGSVQCDPNPHSFSRFLTNDLSVGIDHPSIWTPAHTHAGRHIKKYQKGIGAGEAAGAIGGLIETLTVFRDPSRSGRIIVEIAGRLNVLIGERPHPNRIRCVASPSSATRRPTQIGWPGHRGRRCAPPDSPAPTFRQQESE